MINETEMLKDILEHANIEIHTLQDVILELNREIFEIKGGSKNDEVV